VTVTNSQFAGFPMKLFVEPMNATVVDVDGDGRVNIENEGWSAPTLQEQRGSSTLPSAK